MKPFKFLSRVIAVALILFSCHSFALAPAESAYVRPLSEFVPVQICTYHYASAAEYSYPSNELSINNVDYQIHVRYIQYEKPAAAVWVFMGFAARV